MPVRLPRTPWLLFVIPCALACDSEARSARPAADAELRDGSSDENAPGSTGKLEYRRFVFAGVHAESQSEIFDWYRDVVGLPNGETSWFWLEDGSSVEIFPGGVASSEAKAPEQQSVVTGLEVPDLDMTGAVLESRGVVFLGPLSSSGEDRWRYFADPEGNRFVVKDVGTPRAGSAYEAIPWVGLFVEDFRGMVDWYADVLGLRLVDSSSSFAHYRFGRGDYVELLPGGTASAARKTPAQQSVAAAIEVPDIDIARAELESRGVGGWGEIGMWRVPRRPSERAIEFVDPEGNRWALKDFGKEF